MAHIVIRFYAGLLILTALFGTSLEEKWMFVKWVIYDLKGDVTQKIVNPSSNLETFANKLTGKRSELIYGPENLYLDERKSQKEKERKRNVQRRKTTTVDGKRF